MKRELNTHMSFGPDVLSALENALSDGFEYHRDLDSYLLRAGLDDHTLSDVRAAADAKARASARQWPKAPKRYVVREALNRLSSLGKNGDIVLANLITALCRGAPLATQSAREAVEILKRRVTEDRKEKEAQEDQERREREARDRLAETKGEKELARKQRARDGLLGQFHDMHAQSDSQARGYALERLLNSLFELEGLAPREPFRLKGEQIDGSFSWRNQTHLLEARWRQEPVAAAGFAELTYKTDGKTANTRGLFVSINGYSTDGLQSLARKGSLRFVCIDGVHLMRALQPGGNLTEVLSTVWRHADETGEAYLPAVRM